MKALLLNKYRISILAGVLAVGGVTSLQAATLNVMQNEAPRSMDPGDQTATFTDTVLKPMYEGLVDLSPEYKIEPALATSWKMSDDGKVWTFTLRKNVVFHDGTPFNADAVVVNLQRHIDTKRGLAASSRMRNVVASVKKIDDETVEITLKKVYPSFLNLLTGGSAKMVSPEAEKAGTIGRKADGTGPYMLQEYKAGEYVLQKKNPHYWGKNDGPDQIKWTWSSEPSVMNMALLSGQVDVINPVPPQFGLQLKSNPQIKLEEGEGASVFWLALNTEQKPLNDARVRQALNFATDKDALLKAVMFGFASAANSPLAPVNEGYDSTLNEYPYNVDKAKTLLKDAGYPQGFDMNIAVQGPDARTAQILQAMWGKVGVKVNIQQMESGVWSKAAFAPVSEKLANHTDSVLASWSSGLNGSDLQLRPLYHSQSAAPVGANLGFYKNQVVDELLDKASSTMDDKERIADYVQAQKVIMQDAPHVMLYFQNDLYATRSGIKGVRMEPGGEIIVINAQKP
ncbi:ABC transporter substrate-binding protein [Phytobacter sp. V91]|uniref:ABC transporter substrate-binding protein n=1 Tax=Phytobacter sp. V91 TaxID=3369425 RepID=UPI003F62ADDD